MKKPIWYIFGAGGLGQECLDIICSTTSNTDNYEIRFLEDAPKKKLCNGVAIDRFSNHVPGAFITLALGQPNHRIMLYKRIKETNLHLKSAIHLSAFISSSATIGKGSIIGPFSSVQANAKIYTNSLVNSMSIIGHDCIVYQHSVISSMVNLGGNVIIGAESFIGMGSSIKERVKIGKDCIISMTSVVYNDIPSNIIAVGNPARPAKRNINKKIF